jgi:phage protein U
MNFVLYTWGSILFQVYPLNVSQMNHVTQTDWSKKEIAGAASYREWVGENDEEIHLQGKVFPKYFAREMRRRRGSPIPGSSGGLGHLDVMDNMRRLGQAHALVRGDGWHHGWFVLERLQRSHTFLDESGIGQQIEFDATFQRVPVPDDPAAYFKEFWANLV